MPYELIGKIFIWGMLPLVYIFFATYAHSALARTLRKQLFGRYYGPNFWIEDVYDEIDYIIWRLEHIVFTVPLRLITFFILSPILNTFGFLELAVRYLIYRLHKPTAPAALA